MSDRKVETGPISDASLQALRIFPLPEGVLFPHTVLPLHIFEPRYRAMVAEALAGDRVIAIAMLKPGYMEDYEGRPAIFDTVGVGRITQFQQVQDGRYYLALEGVCRARVVMEHPPQKPFRTAVATRVDDVLPVDGAEGLRHELATLHTALVRLLSHMPEKSTTLSDLLDDLEEPGAIGDILCAAALEDAEARQQALATADVRERLKMATDAIMELILRNGDDPDQGGTGMVQ